MDGMYPITNTPIFHVKVEFIFIVSGSKCSS